MDFELSADQEALRDGVRALCEGRFSIEFTRSLIDGAYVEVRERFAAGKFQRQGRYVSGHGWTLVRHSYVDAVGASAGVVSFTNKHRL